jgi:diacylglycerol kinase (ATP)
MTPLQRHIILNPASGAGRTGKRQAEILALCDRHFGREYTLCITREPGEATDSARAAVIQGAQLVVAVGGDGTIQEVVNGFFSDGRPLNPDCTLGIIDAGTGHGFAQSLRLPGEIERQMELVAGQAYRRVDVGRASYADGDGRHKERYFVNECQAGIGGEVVKKVGTKNKRFGGTLAFGASTLAAALRYPNQVMTVQVDEQPPRTRKLIGVLMANGGFMAGGMKLAPGARLSDGLLDILLIHEQSLAERFRNFPRIYSGTHIDLPKFGLVQGRSIVLSSPESVPLEADGELWGSLPCRVEVLPAVLRVKSPPKRRE